MDKETQIVFRGFLNLNEDQQNQLIKQMNDWIKSPYSRKSEIRKSIIEERVVLGPVGGDKCPCCGR